jgi:hypothetical protein
MVPRKEILTESVKKLLSLDLSDDEVVENLKDVGILEEEARLLIAEAKSAAKAGAGKPAGRRPAEAAEAPAKGLGAVKAAKPSEYGELMEALAEKETARRKEAERKAAAAEAERKAAAAEGERKEVPQEKPAIRTYAEEAPTAAAASVDIAKLWEKGILATVDARLGEMQKLSDDIDSVIDLRVRKALEGEVKKIEVLIDSQRNLLTGRVDAVLEAKSKAVEAVIDTKIAELKNVNIAAQESLKKLEAQKGLNQSMIAEIDSKIAGITKLKETMVTDLNTEIMKSQEKLENFLNESMEKRDSLDKRINRTLELETKITEGLLEDAKQKIDGMAIAKSTELEEKLSQELEKLKRMEAQVNPQLIREKVDELYTARNELVEFSKEKVTAARQEFSAQLDGAFKGKEKEFDRLLRQKESEIESRIRVKEKRLDALMKEVAPERISAAMESLDEFKQQFIQVIKKNVSAFNAAKKELAESMKKRDELISKHVKAIDRKMAELTKFEKDFADELGIVIDKVAEKKQAGPQKKGRSVKRSPQARKQVSA